VQTLRQYAVRAGRAAPGSLATGTYMSINGYGFSVQTARGCSPDELAAAAPNIAQYGAYSYTTIEQLQTIPGVSVNYPTYGQGAYHGTVNVPNPPRAGLFAEISRQFTTVVNPYRLRPGVA
jgi:hypothetical protein